MNCGQNPAVDRSTQRVTGNYYKDTASYECDEGYRLTGNATIGCLLDGNWETAPTCGKIFYHTRDLISVKMICVLQKYIGEMQNLLSQCDLHLIP